MKLVRDFPAEDFQGKTPSCKSLRQTEGVGRGKGRQKKNYILLERVVALLPVVRANDGIGGEGD
jgi:hypothetical protein